MLTIETSGLYNHNVYCPKCGKMIINTADKQNGIDVCPHVAFVATDYGFEFATEQIRSAYENHNDAEDFPEIDEYTSGLDIPEGIKFATYTPPPGDLGAYIGFDLSVD